MAIYNCKKMKIAFFHNLPPGGGRRTIYEQVKGLLKHHEIDVYQITPESSFFDLSQLSCRVFTFPFTKLNSWPSFLNRLNADYRNFFVLDQLHKSIADKINNGGYDVAIIHPDKYTESSFILKYLRIPNIYNSPELLRIGYEPEFAFTEKVIFPKKIYELATRKIRVAIDRNNARCAQILLTDSYFIKEKIKSAYDRDAVVCYSGVDTDVFHPVGKKTKTVLYMGQRNHIGGYDLIQEAFSYIPKSLAPKLESYGFPKGLPDTDNDRLLAKSYSSALATFCVTHNEPFGLKALESMACGTPVLAVDEGGYRESIVDGKTGWLLPRDPKLFAEKIVYLVKHPETSRKMGANARELMVKKWTWKRHVKQLEELIQQAIG
jgi:glycosyltransferase involved in cell wall biosynthesis